MAAGVAREATILFFFWSTCSRGWSCPKLNITQLWGEIFKIPQTGHLWKPLCSFSLIFFHWGISPTRNSRATMRFTCKHGDFMSQDWCWWFNIHAKRKVVFQPLNFKSLYRRVYVSFCGAYSFFAGRDESKLSPPVMDILRSLRSWQPWDLGFPFLIHPHG